MASFAGAGPTSERKKTFKKGVDQEESRRRREETTIQIRKNKKEERLQKRRTAGAGFPPPAGAAGNAMQPQGFDAAVMQKVGAQASIARMRARARAGFLSPFRPEDVCT